MVQFSELEKGWNKEQGWKGEVWHPCFILVHIVSSSRERSYSTDRTRVIIIYIYLKSTPRQRMKGY